MYQSIYNIPCACSLMRNGFVVPLTGGKGKGRRLHIYAVVAKPSGGGRAAAAAASTTGATGNIDIGQLDLTKHPYLQVEPSNSSENLFRCGLHQVQKLNQKLVNEGKMTIDLLEGASTLNLQLTDISLRQSLVQQQLAYLCLSDSTPQSLKLFISKLHEVIKTFAAAATVANNSAKKPEAANKSIAVITGYDKSTDGKDVEAQTKAKTTPKNFVESNNPPNKEVKLASIFTTPKKSNKPQQQTSSTKIQQQSSPQQRLQISHIKITQSRSSEKINRPVEIVKVEKAKVVEIQKVIEPMVVENILTKENAILSDVQGSNTTSNNCTQSDSSQDYYNQLQQQSMSQQSKESEEARLKNRHLLLVKGKRGKGFVSSEVLISSDDNDEETNAVVCVSGGSQTKNDNQQLDDSMSRQERKQIYYQGVDKKKDIEGQFQREQEKRLKGSIDIQSSGGTEAGMISNEKFSLFQEKLQEITSKKKLGVLGKQNVYKVNRGSMYQGSEYEQFQQQQQLQQLPRARQRLNPFLCDEEEEIEEVVDDNNYNDYHHKVDENNEIVSIKISSLKKNTRVQEKAPITEEKKDDDRLKSHYQEVHATAQNAASTTTKTASKFVFEKNNSFSVKKQPITNSATATSGSQITESSSSSSALPMFTKPSQIRNNNGIVIGESTKKPQQQLMKLNAKVGALLLSLPEHVTGRIMSYFSKKDQLNLRIVCKTFNDAVFFCVHSLGFRWTETPIERVMQMLNRARQMRSLQLGALKYVSSAELLGQWKIEATATHLEVLDVAKYRDFNDRLCLQIARSANGLKDLSVHFSSKLSSESLLRLPGLLQNLTRFAMKSSADNFNFHEKISDDMFADFLANRHSKSLKIFEVFTVSPLFFERLLGYSIKRSASVVPASTLINEDSQLEINKNKVVMKSYVSPFDRMNTLKFRNLILSKQQVDSTDVICEKVFTTLGQFKHLTSLKIVNVMSRSKGDWFLPFTPSVSAIKSLFIPLKTTLLHLCIGNWSSNDILATIAECVDSLVKIRIIGNTIDDNGMEYILQKMEHLKYVNISEATRINGHCFETVVSRQLAVVKVSFDDFRVNCLKSTLETHLLLPNIVIINYNKK